MADSNKLVPFILRWEGGFANDPNDLGGATMRGITIGTYEAYCRKKGYPKPTIERLRNMPMSEWHDVFKTLYWDRWRADEIADQRVANILVDWVWASGAYGIKIPQRMLRVTPGGIVGNATLNALNARGASFAEELIKERLAFVDRICQARPANNKFKNGWKRRILSL